MTTPEKTPEIIRERLAMLREELRREHLSAFIFPTTDPHNSEYTADHWKSRQWISGFTGSAGTAVVTLTAAALWTDSRYFIAAAEQLKDTGYVLMKEKISGTPTIAEWLGNQLADDADREVGIDGMTSSISAVEALQEQLRQQGGITLRTNFNPLQRLWHDRPPIPTDTVTLQPLSLTGEDTPSKLSRLRRRLRELHADGMLMTQLDDIAWTLNMRGSDVHCNPVFVSYLLIATDRATLYINKVKLNSDTRAYLADNGITVDDYDNIGNGLHDYGEYNILIDADTVAHTLGKDVRCHVVMAASPVAAMKAVKTAAEQKGMRQAMLRDGVAMVQWLRWLSENAAGQTEMSVSQKLEALRSRQPLYKGLSFDTIAGYEAHGAIVHYEATADTDATLQSKGLLLVDSGAQYQDGTTDITRTIALGPLTDEQRRVYTLVLKGNIRLAMLQFPDGASGTQIDAIAREPLWQAGLNYLHGTGHGVGAFLNVHEGPHQIRMEWRPSPLRSGMTVTDEPGIYLEGRFGVRIENTLLVTEGQQTECGRFLRFEVLTLCPIDTAPIIREMLTAGELQWLNNYHATVWQRLSPHLDADDQQWLRQATKPL